MKAGLPDVLFSDQKYQYVDISEGLGIENAVIHSAILNILPPLGIFNGHLVIL
jgi:hypothetical protein